MLVGERCCLAERFNLLTLHGCQAEEGFFPFAQPDGKGEIGQELTQLLTGCAQNGVQVQIGVQAGDKFRQG